MPGAASHAGTGAAAWRRHAGADRVGEDHLVRPAAAIPAAWSIDDTGVATWDGGQNGGRGPA